MSDRSPHSVSNRCLLMNINDSELKNNEERALLIKYKEIAEQVNSEQVKLNEIIQLIGQIYSKGNRDLYASKKSLQDEAQQISENIESKNRELIALQTTTALKDVLEREKEKALKIAAQRTKELTLRHREQVRQESAKLQQELLANYQKRVEEKKQQVLKKEEEQKAAEALSLNEKLKKKIDSLETAVFWTRLVSIALCVILLFSLSWLAEEVFSHQVRQEYIVQEPYEYVSGTISTYVCYTTDYGSCYHADYCGYLWKSSHKTTVFQAEKNGYLPCSKCNPYESTTLTLTNYGYKDVTHYKYITEPASKWLIWFNGTCSIIVVYLITVTIIKTIIKKTKTRINDRLEEN